MPRVPGRRTNPYSIVSQQNAALQRNAEIKNQRNLIENDTTNARIELQRNSEEAQTALAATQKSFEIIGKAVTAGKKISGTVATLIQQIEQTKADDEMRGKLLEGDAIAAGTVENGSSGFSESISPPSGQLPKPEGGAGPSSGGSSEPSIGGPSGSGTQMPEDGAGPSNDVPKPDSSAPEFEFTPAEEFDEWYNGLLEWIDSTDYSSWTKKSMREQARSYYWAQMQSMSDRAIEQSIADYEDAFSRSLQMDIVGDSQLWSRYGSNPPEGVNYAGIADIYARKDWDDATKQRKAAAYLTQVRYLSAQDQSISIARTQGMAAADQFIQSLGFLTGAEKMDLTSMAQAAFNQMNSIYTGQAESLMEEAFTSGGSRPGQIFQELQDIATTNRLPRETVASMRKSAQEVQREAVQSMISNQLQMDEADGLSALTETLGWVEGGGADSWFYGLPEERDSAITQYRTKINGILEDTAGYLGTTPGAISKSDSETITAFNNRIKDLKNREAMGVMTGAEVMAELDAIVPAYQAQLNTSAGHNSLLSAKMKFVSDAYDDLPSSVKLQADPAFDAFMLTAGIDIDSRSLSDKEKKRVQDTENYYLGTVADLVFEVGANRIAPEAFTELAQKANEGYLLQGKLVSSSGESKVKRADADTPATTAIKSTLKAVDTIWQHDKGDMLVYMDDMAGYGSELGYDSEQGMAYEIPIDPSRRPQPVFFNAGVQETYDSIEYNLRSPMLEFLGIPAESMTASPFVYSDGSALPIPEFHVQTEKGLMHFIPQDGQIKCYDGKGWTAVGEIQDDGTILPVNPDTGEVEKTLTRRILDVLPHPFDRAANAIADAIGVPEVKEPKPSRESSKPEDWNRLTQWSIGSYIRPEYEDTPQGRRLSGVSVDPAIFDAPDYSREYAIRLIRETPELSQIWQMAASQLAGLEREKDSRRD